MLLSQYASLRRSLHLSDNQPDLTGKASQNHPGTYYCVNLGLREFIYLKRLTSADGRASCTPALELLSATTARLAGNASRWFGGWRRSLGTCTPPLPAGPRDQLRVPP